MGFARKVSSVPFGRVYLVPKFIVFARVHPQKSDAKDFCFSPCTLATGRSTQPRLSTGKPVNEEEPQNQPVSQPVVPERNALAVGLDLNFLAIKVEVKKAGLWR